MSQNDSHPFTLFGGNAPKLALPTPPQAQNPLQGYIDRVATPSLFTKAAGRALMIAGVININQIGSFLLMNLVAGAPCVALLAALVRFAHVLYQSQGTSDALWEASLEAARTAIKFFLVYMSWALGMAAAMALHLLTGPALILGLLLVSAVVSLGFTLASFLVDVLCQGASPTILGPGAVAAACEGLVWALVDHIVDISGHINGLIGIVLDVSCAGVVISGAFLLGAWFVSENTTSDPTPSAVSSTSIHH